MQLLDKIKHAYLAEQNTNALKVHLEEWCTCGHGIKGGYPCLDSVIYFDNGYDIAGWACTYCLCSIVEDTTKLDGIWSEFTALPQVVGLPIKEYGDDAEPAWLVKASELDEDELEVGDDDGTDESLSDL